jgi:hypothetical protein
MPSGKSIARRTNMITTSSSSSNSHDHESLGANEEQTYETQTSTHDEGSSSAILPRGSIHSGIHLPKITRLSARTTFQCKFVFSSQRHVDNF